MQDFGLVDFRAAANTGRPASQQKKHWRRIDSLSNTEILKRVQKGQARHLRRRGIALGQRHKRVVAQVPRGRTEHLGRGHRRARRRPQRKRRRCRQASGLCCRSRCVIVLLVVLHALQAGRIRSWLLRGFVYWLHDFEVDVGAENCVCMLRLCRCVLRLGKTAIEQIKSMQRRQRRPGDLTKHGRAAQAGYD